MTTIRAVLFDLDGTLVDSWTVHRRCLRVACTALGVPTPDAVALAAAQRATDLATLEVLVGAVAAPTALAAYHRALEAALPDARVRPMLGAAAVVDALRRTGTATGVCTGRSRAGSQALLRAAGLAVPVVSAREDAARPKPAPDGLRHALAQVGADRHEAVYVGDTVDDARQGDGADVRTILVGRSRHPAARTIDDLTALLAILEETR